MAKEKHQKDVKPCLKGCKNRWRAAESQRVARNPEDSGSKIFE